MRGNQDQSITVAFVGHTTPALAERAAAYEDAVLPLLTDHGARLVFRGRRNDGQDLSLPFEVHLIRFPNRASFDGYLLDYRRAELLEEFGDVFTSKVVVELDAIASDLTP